MLSRSFLPPDQRKTLLAYTPMFHAKLFAENQKYRDTHFQAIRKSMPWLDGNPTIDRPLFVQFCANDPKYLLSAAKLVEPYCDAVDLNLGCPQGIAKKGHYGSFLQEDQELIHRLIKTLHEGLSIPVTAKIRILETREETLEYAKNVLSAGASILTVHGRRREQKGHITGLADWEVIRYLRENLPRETVLFANGNILQHGDIEKCMAATGADGVMSAEGNLSNPGIFAPPPAPEEDTIEYWRGKDGKGGWRVDAVFRRYLDLIHQYVRDQTPPQRRPLFVPGMDTTWMDAPLPFPELVAQVEGDGPKKKKMKISGGGGGGGNEAEGRQSPNYVAMQPHLFHLLRHFVTVHTDVRDALAKSRLGDIGLYENILEMVERKVAQGLIDYEETQGQSIASYLEAVPIIKSSTNGAKTEGEEVPKEKEQQQEEEVDDPESSVRTVRECKRPWWVVQPIVRPLPKEALAKGAISIKGENKKNKNQNGKDKNKEKKSNGNSNGNGQVQPQEAKPTIPTDGVGSPKKRKTREGSIPVENVLL